MRMPLVPKRTLNSVVVAIAIFAISTSSFVGNVFQAANPDWFAEHQTDSEQLVLDGLLFGKVKEPGFPLVLGRYGRSNLSEQRLSPRELYERENRNGSFGAYFSQYGLQLRFLSFLASRGFSLWSLHFVVAAALGLCLSAAYLILRCNGFAGLPAASFPICLALSPWVIVFARNLYWVPFTWFLPALVSALAATLLPTDGGVNKATLLSVFLGLGLFLVALVKFLCGYEYITTVFAASILSFVGLSYRKGVRHGLIVNRCIAITLVFALAFVTALTIHVRQLDAIDRPGMQIILRTAFKRTSSSNPEALASQACSYIKDPLPLRGCISSFSQSLVADPVKVVYGYLFIPSF